MSFKLSKKSIEILQNLSSISSMMILVEGNEQSSSSKTASVYATAKLPDSIDSTFGMYDMSVLLGKFRLFNEDFKLNHDEKNNTVVVYDQYSRVNIPTSNMSRIDPPKIGRDIGDDEYDIQFKLSGANLSKTVEFMKVNGTDITAFSKPDNDPYIRVEGYIFDKLKENTLKGLQTEPIWFIRIEESDMSSFKYYMMLNTKFLDGDYTVKIRQFLGKRDNTVMDKNPDGLNKKRLPAIQFEGEFIRYVTSYLYISDNQKELQNVK